MDIIHFIVPGGEPFAGRLACERRVSATGYPATSVPSEVRCLNCIRTTNFRNAEKAAS